MIYISNFQIPKNSKIIIFSIDNCGYVLDYIFATLLPKNEDHQFYFIIYGNNKEFLKQLIESYKIHLDSYIFIDNTDLYKTLIVNEIQSKILFVNKKNKKEPIILSNYKTIINDLKNF